MNNKYGETWPHGANSHLTWSLTSLMFWVSFILGAIHWFCFFGGVCMAVNHGSEFETEQNKNQGWNWTKTQSTSNIDRLVMLVRSWVQYAALFHGVIIVEIMYSDVNLYEDTLTYVLCSKKAAGWYRCQVFLNFKGVRWQLVFF